MTQKEAARSSCNYDRAKASTSRLDTESIARDFERGSLVAGIVIAVSFGMMLLRWAVM